MPLQNPPIANDQINQYYRYDAEDVDKILKARIQHIRANLRVSMHANLAAEVEESEHLVQILNKVKAERIPGIWLIACNVPSRVVYDNGHWVGIVLEKNSDGGIVRAQYVDSLDRTNTVPVEIMEMFALVYPNVVLQARPCLKQDNDDFVSGGPYLIENLLRTALPSTHAAEHNAASLRKLDLTSVYNYNPSFYTVLVHIKQNPAINAQPQGIPLPVPEGLAELFFSVTAIQANLRELLAPQQPGMAAVSAAELEEQFKAVCDMDGVIKLQIRYVGDNKQLTPFLHRPLWRETKIGFMRDHVSFMIAGLGLAGALLRGPGFTAARDGFAISTVQGVRGMFTAFNPYALGLTAVAMTGSALSKGHARSFAANINTALELYNASTPDSDDVHLIRAQKILSDEFGGGNNEHLTYRAVRWFGTSSDQYEFAHLVWAQILARLGKFEALDKFLQVYDSTSNPTFKGMALIGQICMLADDKTWIDHTGAVILTPATRKNLLDKQVLDLNRNFPKIIQQYLGMVSQAYFDIDQIITTEELAIAFHEFEPLHRKLDVILNFKELHCLRYMQLAGESLPTGKIAEVVYTLAQALCHIVIAKHLEANNNVNNELNFAKQDAALAAAQEKLHNCNELIMSFGLRDPNMRSPLLNAILRNIDMCMERYLIVNATTEDTLAQATPINNGILHTFERWGVNLTRASTTPNNITPSNDSAARSGMRGLQLGCNNA